MSPSAPQKRVNVEFWGAHTPFLPPPYITKYFIQKIFTCTFISLYSGNAHSMHVFIKNVPYYFDVLKVHYQATTVQQNLSIYYQRYYTLVCRITWFWKKTKTYVLLESIARETPSLHFKNNNNNKRNNFK